MGSGSSKTAKSPLKDTRRANLPQKPPASISNQANQLNSLKLKKEPPQKLKLDVNLNSGDPASPLRGEAGNRTTDVLTDGHGEIESEDSEYEIEDLISPSRTLANVKNNNTTVINGGDLSRPVNHQNGHHWTPTRAVSEEQYPESYAKKTMREQYTQNPLLRQKTIYRDPAEWEIEDEVK